MKIANKISLSFLITAVILTTAALAVVYIMVRNNLEKSILDHLMTAASSRANHVETFLEEHKSQVELLASNTSFIQHIEAAEIDTAIAALRKGLKAEEHFCEIFVMDPGGKIVVSTEESHIGLDRSKDTCFSKGKKGPYIEDARYSETTKKYTIAIAVPILDDEDKRFLGVFVARLELTGLYKIVSNRTGLGQTGEIYLINKDYYMVSPSRFAEDVILKQKVDTSNAKHCMEHRDKKHMTMSKMISIFQDYRGIEALGTHAYISSMQWGLLAEIDAKEAFAPLVGIRHLFVVLLVCIPLAAWLIGISVARMISGPIEKLHKGIEIIGQGNLEYKIAIDSKDEIGRLSRAFYKMTGDLRSKTTSIEELNNEINKRKQIEKELRGSEEKYRTILGTLQDGYFEVDQRGNLTLVNNGFCIITGYSLDELIGMRNKVYLVEKNRKRVIAEFNKVWETGEPVALFEYQLERKDGELRTVQTSISLRFDEHGEKIGFIGIVRDVTEHKMAEMVLEKAKQKTEKANQQLKEAIEHANRMAVEAEAANLAKSEFLANMSHEIRTPMNGIIGMTELALATDLTRDQREYLGMIMMSANSLLSIINDVLDFSKIEARELKLDEIDFDLRNTLGNAVDTLALRAHDKELELNCHIKTDVPTALVGDPARLRQIIVNLVGNAIKFTEEGEVLIRVETEMEEDASVLLHFMVSDTGIGIPQDKIASVFDSFKQVDGSIARKYGGTGLGLAISRQLVEMMDGRIWADSPENCRLMIEDCRLEDHRATIPQSLNPSIPQSKGAPGSTFHFTACFGLSRAKVRDVTLLKQLDLSDERALIVDDNATNRLILHDMVSSWGIVPTVAADGKEALARLNSAFDAGKPYRLLLLDLQMPGMSGFEVAKRVKGSAFGADVEIILLASLGEKGHAARCKEMGISGYLTKPVKQSEIFDAIVMALGHSIEEKTPLITRHSIQDARRRLNILLAEDNVVNQRLAMALLEARGHRVVLASNGREAVEALDEEIFDLILMDIQMPEMDGFEATRMIRKMEDRRQKIEDRKREEQLRVTSYELRVKDEKPESTEPETRDTQRATSNQKQASNNQSSIKRIPIVAITAHALKGDREKCLEAGMDDYVSKPINAENLFSVIEKLVHGLKGAQKEKPFSSTKKKEKSSKDVFDLSKALEVVVGNKALFQEIANLFLENLPVYLSQIQEGIAGGDAAALERAAHALKGSVGNFGAGRAYEAAYLLERLGNEGKIGEAEKALAELKKELNALEAEMKSTLQEMKNESSDCRR